MPLLWFHYSENTETIDIETFGTDVKGLIKRETELQLNMDLELYQPQF